MLTEEAILDVRDMTCETRCPMLLETFSNLNPGESFVIVHTFEPVPLKNKLETASEFGVGWERLELGPDFCKVRISKTVT
ncbi:DUF2249 domain-containing protein [Natronogracilivirga saccharolytica]|uniref:DUF2249 domain-containing protein n=1 Tax=Natronogracilivirga saccharolytica TaxID=2812953 RepID=A0A8J7RTV9_9BACT|nr:DUF2249 domain-containing protein [Natronogracilivirga saccharolytica]MBP3192882.1 DUF2249 domain-containing protein [Natronogracilivirga saccharolytica]